jgi:hypothetical protein
VLGNTEIKNGKISSTLDNIPISAENDFKELISVAKGMEINLRSQDLRLTLAMACVSI